ncbi:MAG TPA: hypothetical protein VM597_25715 [Gemmataceae bacterium]|jgi:hypothetical protein|nr:hypothetical protein [Gemmataceae bacterium]
MEIPVLVEPLIDRKGFRATIGGPLSLSADGETREDAIDNVKRLTRDRLGPEGEIRGLALSTGDPLAELAGFLPDDELTREWMEIMNERRRQANESADGLLPEV